ncbi:M23 family metallopeptidase [Campylobacter fetus subsp. venerealis]|uniref:M23 family metallopeptidase n=1 Tax=Campylobacter fetus TaxID=196 RepID=UPI0018E79A7F|nr:M23 family metallopeptidase [Campylobacter fetus]QQF51643.1 M23 family metallopeptidase [Campylobacter fetus subsp. venerealis]
MQRFLLILLLFITAAFSATIGNGETQIISIESQYAGKLTVNDKKISWIDHPLKPGFKIAFVPASYYETKNINVKNSLNGEMGITEFKLVKKDYKQEKITVSESKVKPPQSVMKRIDKERREAQQIYKTVSKGLFFNDKFISPMNSFITSDFGTARVFNGLVKSYHGGTDFRAAVGESVIAANSGIVKIAKDRYYAGKSVVIDHGSGIYTQYYHLSDIVVKVGQKVNKGDILGLSGDSGRVSGPHLHFGVIINNVQVNPLDFISKINMVL